MTVLKSNFALIAATTAFCLAFVPFSANAQDPIYARIYGRILKADSKRIETAPNAQVSVQASDPAFQQSGGGTVDSLANYLVRGTIVSPENSASIKVDVTAEMPEYIVLPEEIVSVYLTSNRNRVSSPNIILRERGNASRFILDKCRNRIQELSGRDRIFSADRTTIEELSKCFDRAWFVSNQNTAPLEQADFLEKNGYYRDCINYFNQWYRLLTLRPDAAKDLDSEADKALTRQITCSRKFLEIGKEDSSSWKQEDHLRLYLELIEKYKSDRLRNDAIALYNGILFETGNFAQCVDVYDLYLNTTLTATEQKFSVSKRAIDCMKRQIEETGDETYKSLIDRCITAIQLDNEVAFKKSRRIGNRDRAQIFSIWLDALLYNSNSGTDLKKFARFTITNPSAMRDWKNFYSALSTKSIPTNEQAIVKSIERFRSQQTKS